MEAKMGEAMVDALWSLEGRFLGEKWGKEMGEEKDVMME
jgi:hypothetical protein